MRDPATVFTLGTRLDWIQANAPQLFMKEGGSYMACEWLRFARWRRLKKEQAK
jgi:hypothetical protein